VRAALRAFVVAAGLALAVLGSAPSAGAQTTTTIPPIPVTGGGGTTATTAPAPAAAEDAGTAGMADTGLATDRLVPFGFVLIGAGAALDAVARRRPKQRLVLG
jgi:hypothetical protein